MPSHQVTLESDYLVLTVTVTTESESISKYLEHANSFPEGSAARLEREAAFYDLLSGYISGLAAHVRARGALTIYDI